MVTSSNTHFRRSSAVDWQVEDGSLFRTFGPLVEEDTVQAFLLLQVNNAGEADDGFRAALGGNELNCEVWCRDLVEVSRLRPYRLMLEVRPAEVEFKLNSLTTRWEDLDSFVATGRAAVFKGAAKEDESAEFRRDLATSQEEDADLGMAVRWILQADGDHAVRVTLQGLPGRAKQLNRHPRLAGDSCPAVVLHSRVVETDFLER